MRRRGGDRGQAAVELALALPVLAMLLLVVVQIALVVRAQVLVTHAAREAARAAAVDPDPAAATAAAQASADLDPQRLRVDTGPRGAVGGRVSVSVSYVVVTDVPLVGLLVGDVTVRSEATMRVEGALSRSRAPPMSRSRSPAPSLRGLRVGVAPAGSASLTGRPKDR